MVGVSSDVQKISLDVRPSVCVSVWHQLSHLLLWYYTMLVLQQVCVFLHYSVYTIVCVFYTYKDQMYSHGCKHEVNSPKWGQPEVLIALKVSTEGKGHYACYNKGEGLRLCVSEWGPCKYSMSECVFMCVYVLTLWTQLNASSSVSSISTFVSFFDLEKRKQWNSLSYVSFLVIISTDMLMFVHILLNLIYWWWHFEPTIVFFCFLFWCL